MYKYNYKNTVHMSHFITLSTQTAHCLSRARATTLYLVASGPEHVLRVATTGAMEGQLVLTGWVG